MGVGGRPDLSVQLLVGVNVFTLDKSLLDGPDHLGWDASTDWSDIICSVNEAHWVSGTTRVQGALTRYETGTCELTLYDTDRRYDPSVGGSGQIRPGTPIRIRASQPGTPLPYGWAWTTGTGTITPTPTGVLLTPDPRGASANWNCRATGTTSPPIGSAYRATCRARLVSGTPNGTLRMIVGGGDQTPNTSITIPTDGSWVPVDATLTSVSSGWQAQYVYMQTGGTAQVTVEVDSLLMVLVTDTAGWSETLWTGVVDAVNVDYSLRGPNTVSVEASDLGRRLVLYNQNAEPSPVGLNDDIVARVKRALRQAGIDDTLATGGDPVGTVLFQSTDLARTGWETVTDAVDAELGRAWVTRDNLMKVKARLSGYDGPIRGTISNTHVDGDPTHLCVTDATMSLGAELLTNRAVAAPAGGTVVQVDNTASQAKYGAIHSYDRRDLILKDQTAATDWATFLVYSQAEAELRIDQLAPVPQGNPVVWRNVCATGINDRWQVTLTPRTGPAFDRTAAVLGVEHTVTRQTWDIVWRTLFQGVGQQGGWFWLDQSLLDGPDLLKV